MNSSKTNKDEHLLINRQKKKNQELARKGKPQKVYDLIRENYEKDIETASGDKYCICKTCGKEFEQTYVAEVNAYQTHKTCHVCRFKRSQQIEEKEELEKLTTVVVKYAPYPWQQRAHEDIKKHRFLVIAAGARCFFPDSFISGCDKPISEIKKGEYALAGNGEIQKVTYCKKKCFNGNAYRLKAFGLLPTTLTEEHQILVSDKSGNAKYEQVEKTLDKKNYMLIPKIKGKVNVSKWKFEPLENKATNCIETIPLNNDIAWLCGLYCSTGYYFKEKNIKIVLNADKTEVQEKTEKILKDLKFNYDKQICKNNKYYFYFIHENKLAKLFKNKMGDKKTNKTIPFDILYHKNQEILISFLKGFFNGSGEYHKKAYVLNFTTTSKKLAINLQLAIAKLNGFAKLCETKKQKNRTAKDNTSFAETTIYYKGEIVEKEVLQILGYAGLKRGKSRYFITDEYIGAEIISLHKATGEFEVYDISVNDGKVVCNSAVIRQCGKDRMANMEMIFQYAQLIQEQRHIKNPNLVPAILMWIVAPTFPMAQQNWRELKHFFPKEWVVSISEGTMTMQCAYGAIIEVRSAHDPESLVGVGLDFVTITEAARIRELETVWGNLEDRLNSPHRGIGGDRCGGNGHAIINSSPRGKDYFYKMWTWGQRDNSNYDGNFISYKLPTTENPEMAALYSKPVTTKTGEIITYGESLKRRKGRKFLQDNMAEFIGVGGVVFEGFSEKCVFDPFSSSTLQGSKERKEFIDKWKKPKPYHTYRLGYDPATGSGTDDPTLIVLENETKNVVNAFNMYGKIDDVQWNFVAMQARIYNNAEICILKNGFLTVPSQLRKRGCLVTERGENGANKADLVQGLRTAVQNGDVHVCMDGTQEIEDLIAQIEDYTEHANGRYSNQTQPHDDYVSALYATYYDYNTVEENPQYYYSALVGVDKY